MDGKLYEFSGGDMIEGVPPAFSNINLSCFGFMQFGVHNVET